METETEIELPEAKQLARAIGETARRLTLLRELQRIVKKRDRHAEIAEKTIRESEGRSNG
jgi:hypothetical protein